MTVLHFIKNLDKNNLSGLFMNDLLKGGIDKTTTHILTMSVNDNMEDLMKHATVYRLSRKIWSARANWLKLESIVKSIRPDIIHIHSLGGFDAWMIFKFAQKERIPIVISPYKELMDWNFHNKYLRRKLPLLCFFQHDMLKEAAAILCVSEQEQEGIHTVSWCPGLKAKDAINANSCLVQYAKETESGVDTNRVVEQMGRFYRKVADSNPFMLMSGDDRKMESDLLALGVSLIKTDGNMDKIFLPVEDIKKRAEELSDEKWRLIQLHSESQGILQLVLRAMDILVPGKIHIDITAIERFGHHQEIAFLETTRAHIRVSRIRQLCDTYSHDDVEKKICIMMLNLKYLADKNILTRKNIVDVYAVLRFETYNEYLLENMLDEIGMKKYAQRILKILQDSMGLEDGFAAMALRHDRTQRRIENNLFKSNIQ